MSAPPAGAETSANLVLDYYEQLPRVVALRVPDPAPVEEAARFSPGFGLPELDPQVRQFFAAAEVGWVSLPTAAGPELTLLDLARNPGTQTTKTLASLLIVARAVDYIRRTGEPIVIFSPTSANKGTGLRDAVERALAAGLVSPTQLRVVVLAPGNCAAKQRASRLSDDPQLRALNPVLRYAGPDPEGVKALGKAYVTHHAEQVHRRYGANLWFTLELDNYIVADAARAFVEQDVSPARASRRRVHAHAVSSAFGLLGYNLGRDLLEHDGRAAAADRPGFLLVQHLGTPDMVCSLLASRDAPGHGAVPDYVAVPDYTADPASGLLAQEASPHFPSVTFARDEVLDPTFYTRRPVTSPTMNGLIGRYGGDGIVVSLAECLQRYPGLRQQLADSGRTLPADPRTLTEWSLAMVLTGVHNAAERGLLAGVQEVVVHGSGSYATTDYRPLPESAVAVVDTPQDVAAAVERSHEYAEIGWAACRTAS